jgi:dTDP-4-amino-4,6-dideoxygalactose transaminase
MKMIPFIDLKAQNAVLKPEILPVWEELLESASFIGGEQVTNFEAEFAKACTVKQCVAVNSGTDALRLIFLALGLQAGDEVITVPNTFIATTEAISQTGARIRFVDIDPVTYNMDPSLLDEAVTSKTKAIVPIHLYGQCANMDAIHVIAQKHGLWVVEDACQAHLAEYKGSKAGSLGIAGAFSFYPGKNLGACGEAGCVTTDDEDLAQKIRMLRDHGQRRKYLHEWEGYNGRCDAVQAAVLRIKLKHLDRWNAARRRNASMYDEILADCPEVITPKVSSDCLPVYHLYIIQVEQRDKIAAALNEDGIATGLHYPIPLHLQEAYRGMALAEGTFPVTERVARRLLSLPMYPELSRNQIEYVCDRLKNAIKSI